MHSTALILSLSVMIMMVNSFVASYPGGNDMSTGIYGNGTERMVDGTPTTVDKYPHVCAIMVRGDYFCGGSIIAPNCILTAAHCVLPLIKYNLKGDTKIVTGTTYFNKGGHSYKMDGCWHHPEYDVNARGRTQHDMGLIKVQTLTYRL
ncbi:PREDICTED: trypsin epsilon-like [Wasmannia auropunctata]|uniref:trypsin epsilon-like n=1 Tax=Wasmannia auropunctata TaxID=64793 RepID=UPI0005F03996|nr:PREDICTED: trypsin epsilon-like [Wasmannia auropunctata]